MSNIVLPETSPPLVSPEALDKISNDILYLGLETLWDNSLPIFYDRQPILFAYVKVFETLDANGKPLVDLGPKRALRTGAVIAERAYMESGYELPIHDIETFNIGYWEAKHQGLPEAYLLKSIADSALQGLIAVMLDTPNMQDGAEKYGSYEHFIAIGAGLTRHYLQFELALNN